MITLLTAVLGKDIIPNHIRMAMLAVGVSVLSYKLIKVYQMHSAHKEIAKVDALAVQKTAPVTAGVVNALNPQSL